MGQTRDLISYTDLIVILQGLNLNTHSHQPRQHAQSLSDRCLSDDQNVALDATARLLLVFDFCGRYDWKSARTAIDRIRAIFVERDLEIPEETARILLYLDAMCKQAQGDLHGALTIYQSPDLAFEPDVKLQHLEKDFRVLSTLNSIMILRTLGPKDADKANNLHAAIETYCLNHQDKSFSAAYYMTKALTNESNVAIIKRKQHISSVSSPCSHMLYASLDLTFIFCRLWSPHGAQRISKYCSSS